MLLLKLSGIQKDLTRQQIGEKIKSLRVNDLKMVILISFAQPVEYLLITLQFLFRNFRFRSTMKLNIKKY